MTPMESGSVVAVGQEKEAVDDVVVTDHDVIVQLDQDPDPLTVAKRSGSVESGLASTNLSTSRATLAMNYPLNRRHVLIAYPSLSWWKPL